MMRLAEIAGRFPRWVMFAAAALVQIALIALMIVGRIAILRDGAEITLQARPVDPRDLLRGDYVVLSYTISSLLAGELGGQPFSGAGMQVFVKLAPSAEGFYQAVSVHQEPVAVTPPERLIHGRIASDSICGDTQRTYCGRLNIKYGIESYFVPQGEGLAIEQARNQGKVAIVAAVTPDGRAAIKRLLIDGKPVYDEPLF
jgi:uncharacterized membrane-anchored protein